MKIVSIEPPEIKYTLELTESQLVGLGLLSYRHECVSSQFNNFINSFFRHLPDNIRHLVVQKNQTAGRVENTTVLGVGWDA